MQWFVSNLGHIIKGVAMTLQNSNTVLQDKYYACLDNWDKV